MSNEDRFFAEMQPQAVEVLGLAGMQVLEEQREPSREVLMEMLQEFWQEDQVDPAVEVTLDVLLLPKS